MNNKIIAIIPALNPQMIIFDIVDNLVKSGFRKIIVVDDGSTENLDVFLTLGQMKDVIILKHPVNLGKGRALKTAFIYVLNNFSECLGVITIDADGQHKNKDIQKCAEVLKINGLNREIILGCRQFKNIDNIPLRSRFGNYCTRYILCYLCNLRVSDSQTGLRGIPMELLPEFVKIPGEGYEYETNMLLELTDRGGILEVPIETVYENGNNTSHFNPIRDSIKIYRMIIKYSLSSLLSAIIDNLIFIILSFYSDNIYKMTFTGRIIAAFFNFLINKKIVFRKEGKIIKQSIEYICLLLVSGAISALCVSFLHKALDASIVILKLIVEFILYFVNFYVQKNIIFKKDLENV